MNIIKLIIWLITIPLWAVVIIGSSFVTLGYLMICIIQMVYTELKDRNRK